VDWETLAGMAALLTLQSAAFGLVLSWLRNDLVGLRGEVAAVGTEFHADLAEVRSDIRRLEETLMRDF
jgi:hypothetical protein